MEEKDENLCLFKLGEERVHSIQTLFRYFCYHLHRGEWELSGACVNQLNDEGISVDVNIKEILLNVIQFPFGRRLVTKNDFYLEKILCYTCNYVQAICRCTAVICLNLPFDLYDLWLVILQRNWKGVFDLVIYVLFIANYMQFNNYILII